MFVSPAGEVNFYIFCIIVAPKSIMLTTFSQIRLRDDKVSIYIPPIPKRKTESSVGLARERKASLGLFRKNAKHCHVNGVTCERVSRRTSVVKTVYKRILICCAKEISHLYAHTHPILKRSCALPIATCTESRSSKVTIASQS